MPATRLMLVAALLSIGIGFVVVRQAPKEWGVEGWQGALLGSALYMGALHRILALHRAREADTERETAHPSLFGAMAWRALAFLALAVGQGYAYFEWLPAADLRAPYVMLSCWIVGETMLAPRGGAAVPGGRAAAAGSAPATAPSRRA